MAGEPIERIAEDNGTTSGDREMKKNCCGNRDYFTKWTEAYAIKDHKAETIAKLLVEEIHWEIPGVIHTDQGRDFEGHPFRNMCNMMDIEKTKTTPWHPLSDSMIEVQQNARDIAKTKHHSGSEELGHTDPIVLYGLQSSSA